MGEISVDDAVLYLLRQKIAAKIDHPSVYMGGPSPNAIRKAIAIVRMLDADWAIDPKDRTLSEVQHVQSWRKSPWDSMERI